MTGVLKRTHGAGSVLLATHRPCIALFAVAFLLPDAISNRECLVFRTERKSTNLSRAVVAEAEDAPARSRGEGPWVEATSVLTCCTSSNLAAPRLTLPEPYVKPQPGWLKAGSNSCTMLHLTLAASMSNVFPASSCSACACSCVQGDPPALQLLVVHCSFRKASKLHIVNLTSVRIGGPLAVLDDA